DPNDGSIASTATWDTDTAGKIPAFGSRSIFSYNPVTSAGINFIWGNLDATQQSTLLLTGELNDALAQARVSYLRGDASNELDPVTNPTGPFRKRNKLMGDIVNSNPWFVGIDDFGYSDLPGTEGSSYLPYLSSIAGRTKTLYVGANDGMLHAIDAGTGDELFAYVPAAIIPELTTLTQPSYGTGLPHQYFVDGSPRAGDVYFSASSDWRSVLVGTMGAAARAVFALDATDPDNFDATKVLWEFTNSDDSDLGYTLGDVTIARMANGQWAAIMGNGYNSDNDSAVLYILDIENGNVIKKIDTGTGTSGTPNGLAAPIPIDLNGDHITDSIYAGDLLGNMWKFDVSDPDPSNWAPAFGTAPLFVAKDSSNTIQPITAKPQVGLHPNGGVMVYFGTGKYFESGDNIVGPTPQVQTYYGIRDNYANGSSTPVSGRSVLVEQTIDAEASFLGVDVRVTSDNIVDYTSKLGWYMDLESPANGAEGERVISPSLLRGDRLIFTTILPSSDPCAAGGTSWLMELEAVTGGRLSTSPFDINNDGVFTVTDLAQLLDTNGDGVVDNLDDKLVVSGKKSTIGIIKTPSVISAGTKEYKYTSGSTGALESTTESAGANSGRQSWRQLR
ncbi:Type IV fimbrial biogenesis protein PilY1, partial [hydrothermal vent metagenome]